MNEPDKRVKEFGQRVVRCVVLLLVMSLLGAFIMWLVSKLPAWCVGPVAVAGVVGCAWHMARK